MQWGLTDGPSLLEQSNWAFDSTRNSVTSRSPFRHAIWRAVFPAERIFKGCCTESSPVWEERFGIYPVVRELPG
eukprot:660017-Amorphochlora_amoeboformis.AAC.1